MGAASASGWVATLATAADVLPSPESVAGGISKLGLYYIIGILAFVIAWLTYKLLDVQQHRISDRDKFQDRLELLAKEMHSTVAENGKAFWATQRELQRLEPKQLRPKPPPEGTP